ncbi:MAG: hypothetical protein GY940_24340 [bacterium]|nr:hypothetical protein [bacterium]
MVRNIVFTSESLSYPERLPNKGSPLSQTKLISVKDMKYKPIIELLPSLSSSRIQERDLGDWAKADSEYDFGFTGKISISNSLVLDATVNPDFSQVESDAGQIDVNLRYDLYFPEKRPFFLEGIEEFRYSGSTPGDPLQAIVHTRRIINPVVGLKLTGKIGSRTSIASIFAIDDLRAVDANSLNKNATFGIFRFKHAIKDDVFVGGFYTGRDEADGYNRILGIDGRLRLSKTAVADYNFIGSLSKNSGEDHTDSGYAMALRYWYHSQKASMEFGLQDVSNDFRVDTGFLNRNNYNRIFAYSAYRFYPKSKFFQRIDPYYWSYHLRDKESNLWETFNLFVIRFHMPGRSWIRFDGIYAREVFAGRSFETSGGGIQAIIQLGKEINFYLLYRNRGSILYNPLNPLAGRSNSIILNLLYQPLEKFSTELDVSFGDFVQQSNKEKLYDFTIARIRTTYQVNKYLFFRGVTEYNFFRDKLQLDALASFTYIPGTVVHIGWGSLLEKRQWDKNMGQYIDTPRLHEFQRGFFFKVSYLWRL